MIWQVVGSGSGLKLYVLGHQAIQVMFFWVKWVWPRFCIGSHILIMVSGPDQSNELSTLHGDDEAYLLILLKILQEIDCTIRLFWLFGAG